MSGAIMSRISRVIERAEASLKTDEVINYEEYSRELGTLNTLLRETIQATLQDTYEQIASKLENDEPLSNEEQEHLRLLIVGDAKYYLTYENNLEDWRDELKRLTVEMKHIQDGQVSTIDDRLHLRALCRDAQNVAADIAFYLRERDRLKRFEAHMQGTRDRETGKLLAAMIREMLESKEM